MGGIASDEKSVLEDPVRLRVLRATGLLDEEAVQSLERVARLAARVLRAPVAQVNLVTADAQIPRAAYVDPCSSAAGEEADWRGPVGLDRSYCQHVVSARSPLRIGDARQDPLVRDCVATLDAGIVAYAAVPLCAPEGAAGDGAVLGSVCVVDFVPRTWTDEDLALLEDVATNAAAEVARRLAANDALVESDARFRAVFEQAAIGMGRVSFRDARWLDVNDAFCRMLGYSREQLLSTPWPEITYPEDVDLDFVPFRRMAAGELERYSLEKRFIHASGELLWARLTLSLVRDAAGRPDYEIAIIEDISERKAAAEERERLLRAERAARAEAEAANQTKSHFLTTMSHELRTPLNAIQGHVQLIEMGIHGAVTPAQQEALARVQDAQCHLLGLIDDVLDFANLGAGRVEYDTRPVLVSDVVRQAMPLVDRHFRGRGQTLEVSLPEDPERGEDPIRVWADPDKLCQLLVNLLSNAAKFTPAPPAGSAPAAVRVELVASEQSPELALLHVRDRGIGIASDKLEMVFDPFVQIQTGHTRTRDGTGLGLAISRELARGMGGELSVESTLGVGSTFTVTLRRVRSASGRPVDRRSRKGSGPAAGRRREDAAAAGE